MTRLAFAPLALFAALCFGQEIQSGEPLGTHFAKFGAGAGPENVDGDFRLLDAAGTKYQSNAIAFDVAKRGASDSIRLDAKLRVLKGGDGGAFVFLNTAAYGARGPAPFVKSWVEPNLKGTFAVGIDVHNPRGGGPRGEGPKDEEMFSAWGNYMGKPQREISLHWNGREIVKRTAPVEFRGDWAQFHVSVAHVVGGAKIDVSIGGKGVFRQFFIPGMLPYETRLVIGAGTRADASTEFDVKDLIVKYGGDARPRRAPKHFDVFNHVLTNNKKTAYETEVQLPPANWEFARVILTLDIHDAGASWDEWDRNGEISVYDKEGVKRGIVPFITSYRTECHWQIDITHFRPWLSGKTKFEVRAGTNFYKNRGYMMSVSLDYYHGRPVLQPYKIVPLWNGKAKYKSAENHFQDFFKPVKVLFAEPTKAALMFMTTTGHSYVGEFTPSDRTIVFQADATDVDNDRLDNTLWKDDCYLNPNRPQRGTWKYSRAGWAPGDLVWPWIEDLSERVKFGKTARFRYEPEPYDFEGEEKPPTQKQINQASHVIRSYVILYRDPGEMMAAPTLQIAGVVGESAAAAAGVKRGDYLASYDGQTLHSLVDLRAAIGGAAKKESVTIVVYRGVKRMEITIAPGRMGVKLASR